MRLRSKFILTVLLLLIGVTSINVSFVSSQQSLKIEVYYVDGSQVFDKQRANYLISYGYVLSRSELFKSINKLSEWDLGDPMLNKYVSFFGYEYGLTDKLLNLFNVSSDVFIKIFVTNDIIKIITSDYEHVSRLIDKSYTLISNLYLSTLRDFLSSRYEVEATTKDLISYIGGSLKIVIIEEPIPGYPYSDIISDRYEYLRKNGLKPDFIGGYAYDGAFGYYHFLIYLSCHSEDFNYSYNFDEIYNDVDMFIKNLFDGIDVPIILDILDECIKAMPDMESGYTDLNNLSSDEAPNDYVARINILFVKEYTYVPEVGPDFSEDEVGYIEKPPSFSLPILIASALFSIFLVLIVLKIHGKKEL